MKTRTAVSARLIHSTRRKPAAPLTSSSRVATNGDAPKNGALASGVPRLVPARAGDHPAIHRLLKGAFHGPTPTEFQAQIDEPLYDPASRLVVKRGDAVAAHVRTIRREIRVAGAGVPAVRLMDLATAAEYRSLGFASSLLAVAERRARDQGVLLALTRTRAASLFARLGWVVCGRHVFSTAGARQILAHLGATSEGTIPPRDSGEVTCLLRSQPPAIAVRPLRRIELPAVMRLYEQSLATRSGSPIRSDAYWEWLLNRRACDQAYVVADGPESSDMKQQLASIRGYVFVNEGRIVELMVEDNRRDLAEHLIARVCADASERDHWQVRLDAPADDSLHELFQAAAGQTHWAEEMGGEVFMAKVLDVVGFLAALQAPLAARHAAALQRPLELGLEIRGAAALQRPPAGDATRLQLVFGERGMSVVPGQLGRSYLSLDRHDLAPLVLGHCELGELIESGRATASSKGAQTTGRALFPRLPWWRPPLDDLLA